MSAAIIDDVIGIIVLTFVIGFKNPDSNPGKVVLNTALFFVFAIVVGLLIYKLIKFLDNKYPHTRRIPIIGLSLCLAFAYIAERYFGIADITGAYVAGIILCSIRDSEYIAEKMDINADNVDEIMEQELANVFANVLENAGVFKDDEAGNAGWDRFIAQL